MHPDLVLISNLWSCDSTIDRLKAEYEALVAANATTTTALAEAEKKLAENTSRLDGIRSQERTKTREMEEYQQRRVSTQRMIDTGTTPNYAASEKQLAQTIQIIDGLETELLELMEQREAAEKEQKALIKEREQAVAAREKAARAKIEREPGLRAEMAAILPKKEEAAKAMPAEYRNHYAELRRKKRVALVNVDGEICQSCSMAVPPQRIVETRMLRAVHTCPGCQGYLLP